MAMAEFLLSLWGYASSKLFSIISKLLGEASLKWISIIFKQFGLLVGVKEEQRALESKLQMIRRVIRRAEELRLEEDDMLRDFIEKLKGAAYDIEDLVDEFMAEALRQQIETRDGMLKKVCNFFSTSNPLVFCYKMAVMARKIQALKKSIDAIVKKKKDFDCAELFWGHIPPPPVSQDRETHSFVNEDEVYGRDGDKANLIRTLINSDNESNVSVIAIVGMGGMGKTTLAKLVFNDQTVVTHFHLRKWIYVSDAEFHLKSLLKKFLQSPSHNASGQSSRGQSQTSNESSMEDLQTQLQKALRKKKYLLVLDDVWNECREKWLELESLLRCGSVGSKILVTTRSDKVALSMGALQTLPLRELPENECLSLFKKLAFGDKQELNENLVKIGEEIVRKCGGVPLAVKTVGSLMYSKESVREWEHVRDSESWLQDKDTGILPALRLSYNHLMPSLKECFAYCFVFPKGGKIDVDKLIKQWIAQGFILSSEENELLEEKGEDIFKTLWSRSFFQDVKRNDDGDMASCTMHDRVHDLARAIAGNGFAFSGMHKQTTLQKTRHLSMTDLPEVGSKKYMKAFKNFDKMRSVVSIHMKFDVNICFRFRRLRLLDISRSSIKYLPKSIGKLKHLRYLDLSGTLIEELPETICNLFNLQTLIFYHSRIRKLPEGMRRMISLRHIESMNDIEQMPNGIGELASIRTLPRFVVGEKSGCGIEELKILNLLRGDLIIERLDNIKNVQCACEANLEKKKYLRTLTLSYGEVGDMPEGIIENVIEELKPHSGLEGLSIDKYMGRKFPTWMEQMRHVTDLRLYACKKCQHLSQLSRLSSLELLHLCNMDAIEYIVKFDSGYDKESIFPKLKELYVAHLCNLKRWSIVGANVGPSEPDDQLFPCLSFLSVQKCPNLTSFPKGLGALEKLKMFDVGCSMLDISSSLSLEKLELSKMPNLEGLSSQKVASNDGQVKQAESRLLLPCLLSMDISSCPKLTHLPPLVLPALKYFYMKELGLHKIQLTSNSPSMYAFYIGDMPDLQSWSSQVDDDDDRHEKKAERLDDAGLSCIIEYCPKMIDMPQLPPSLNALHIKRSNEKLLRSIAYYTSLSSLTIHGLLEITSLLFHLPALMKLEIDDCPDLVLILPDGLLSSLEDLCIRNSCKKQTVFLGRVGIVFHSLRKLQIEGWRNLESLYEGLQQNPFPTLQELRIIGCPNLVLMLPDGLHRHWLSSLQFMDIKNSCKKQVFQGGDGIVFHSLRKLWIRECENLESLYEGLQQNLIPALQELRIRDCPNLVLMLPDGLHQHWLSSLQDLTIINSCKKQTVFPGGDGIVFHSLRKLWIEGCENLESLCEGLQQNLIPTLEELMIQDCPNLMPFPNGSQHQCLNSLKDLRMRNSCKQLTSFPGGGGDGITLTSLRMLLISGFENLEHLFEGLKENHITSLEQLNIENCPKLGNLPKWLGNLTSLKKLVIISCPTMNALPTKLQKSLIDKELTISACPLLERRIQKERRG